MSNSTPPRRSSHELVQEQIADTTEERIEANITRIKRTIGLYEWIYGMSSSEMRRRVAAGEMDETNEICSWPQLVSVHENNYYLRDARDRIKGFVYRYHAQFTALPLRQIFRYDNDHLYAREGHPDAFHKHVFNDCTWKELEVVHIGREAFPTLLEVIDELYDWWLRKRDDPLVYP